MTEFRIIVSSRAQGTVLAFLVGGGVGLCLLAVFGFVILNQVSLEQSGESLSLREVDVTYVNDLDRTLLYADCSAFDQTCKGPSAIAAGQQAISYRGVPDYIVVVETNGRIFGCIETPTGPQLPYPFSFAKQCPAFISSMRFAATPIASPVGD